MDEPAVNRAMLCPPSVSRERRTITLAVLVLYLIFKRKDWL